MGDLELIRHYKARVAMMVADGAEHLLPWFLAFEAMERELVQGGSDLQRAIALAKSAAVAA